MSEIKFTCPHCSQHVQCDESWSGRETRCPACQGAFRVPQSAKPTTSPASPSPPLPPLPPPASEAAAPASAQKPEAPLPPLDTAAAPARPPARPGPVVPPQTTPGPAAPASRKPVAINNARLAQAAGHWEKLRRIPWSWVVLGLAVVTLCGAIFGFAQSPWFPVIVMVCAAVVLCAISGPRWPATAAVALGFATLMLYPPSAFRSLMNRLGVRLINRAHPFNSAQTPPRTPVTLTNLVSSSKWNSYSSSRQRSRNGISSSSGVAFVPGGKLLAVATKHCIELWEPETAMLYRTLPSVALTESLNFGSLSFSADGRMLACISGGYSSHDARLFDLRTGELVRTFSIDVQNCDVTSLALSPNGQILAGACRLSYGQTNYVALWNVSAGSVLRILTPTEKVSSSSSSFSSRYSPPVAPTTPRYPSSSTHPGSSSSFASRYGLSKPASNSRYIPPPVPPPSQPSYSYVFDEEITSMAFAPDGKHLACGYKTSRYGSKNQGAVRIWNVSDGTMVRQRYSFLPKAEVSSLAFSPDGKTLACGYSTSAIQRDRVEVRLWNTEGPDKSWTLPISTQASLSGHAVLKTLAFSPDGKYLVGGFSYSLNAPWQLIVWDLQNNTVAHTLTDPAIASTQSYNHPDISGISFSPNGKRLACGFGQSSGNNAPLFLVWDISAGRLCHSITETDFNRSVGTRAIAVSSDGDTLAFGTSGPASRGEINIIKTGPAIVPRRIPDLSDNPTNFSRLEFVSALAFMPGSSKVICAYGGLDSDDVLKIWNTQSGVLEASLAAPASDKRWSVVSLALSPDGRSLLCACKDAGSSFEARLWDLEAGTLSYRTPVELGSPDALVFAAFAPTNQPALCTCGGSGKPPGRLEIFDPQTGKLRQTLEAPSKSFQSSVVPTAMAFSSDGRTLLGAYSQIGNSLGIQSLKLWDTSGETLRPILREEILYGGSITALAFCRNGNSLVCSTSEGVIKQWDITITKH